MGSQITVSSFIQVFLGEISPKGEHLPDRYAKLEQAADTGSVSSATVATCVLRDAGMHAYSWIDALKCPDFTHIRIKSDHTLHF
jgi:hypothetical protein